MQRNEAETLAKSVKRAKPSDLCFAEIALAIVDHDVSRRRLVGVSQAEGRHSNRSQVTIGPKSRWAYCGHIARGLSEKGAGPPIDNLCLATLYRIHLGCFSHRRDAAVSGFVVISAGLNGRESD